MSEKEKIDTLDVKKQDNNEIVSPWKLALRRLKKNKLAIVGAFILIAMIVAVIVGPMLMPYSITDTSLTGRYAAPTAEHILGTDANGRDILYRLLYGGRVSMMVGVVAVTIEVLLGILVGGVSGFYGGNIDRILMALVDIILSIPSLPLLIVLGAMMSDMEVPPSLRIYVVMFIIGLISWPGLARLIRGQILSFKEQEFMLATEALGIRNSRKILGHLVPNVVPTIIVSATLGLGGAIMLESALSFIGLGVAPPYPTWGNMVQAATDYINVQKRPWLWIPPGVCIFLVVMAINLFGDGLRDALDPKLKR